MKLKLVGAEAIRSIRASMSTTIAATMTVLIGMFLLGLSIALGTWVLSYSNHVKSSIHVKVNFCTTAGYDDCRRDATAPQMNAVIVKLRALPEVKSVKFISKEDALTQMQKRRPDLVNAIPYNPFPNSLEVTPRKAEYAKSIRQTLIPPPHGVHDVNAGGETARRVIRVGKIVESVFLIGVLLLLIASTLLIGNTIRLSIFSRRREIEVMKLVGASNWFVRGPFVLEGLICGLVGSVAAVVLLILGKTIALPAILGHVNDSSQGHALAFEANAVIILATGLLLAAAGSGLTLRRFLKV
jgi:cell division transport system permease protein